MDKYLITAFRSEIATAILNSQQKLNPDGDAYISKDELQGVLDFFGEKDINKLLKDNDTKSGAPNSIFEGQSTSSSDVEQKDLSEYTDFMKTDNAALRDDGTAAYELQNSVASDLLTSSTGTPYEAQMKSGPERTY